MEDNKHTKGEWKVRSFGAMPNKRITSQDDRTLCDMYSFSEGISDEEAETNAMFICKAVNNHYKLIETLEFCKNILNEISTQNCWKGEKENLVNIAEKKAETLLKSIKIQ